MNKKIKIAGCAALVVVYTAVMLIFVFPWNKAPKNFTQAKDGVVSIHTKYGTGSGFAIGKQGKSVQYIVTNYHVVFEDDKKADEVTVYFSEAANRFMTAQIYAYDADKDIAILKLPEPTTERKALTLRKYKDTDTSATYYALGYPGRAEAGADYIKYDVSDIVTTSGMISKQSSVGGVEAYMLDLEITHGNSGGPLVNAKGEVVGINTFSISNAYGEAANYAICADEILKIVDPEYVDFTVYGADNTRKILTIVFLAIGDIALAAFAVISAVKLAPNTAPQHKVNYAAKTDKTIAADYGQTIAVDSRQAVICGIAGIYAGKEFKIDGRLVFGRDSSKCDVVFPVDTEGVSGGHCVVAKNGPKVIIRDIGSTYGTFINNGLKIDRDFDVELGDGDTFYLGSEKQKFVVRMK